ncbi:MAG: DUF933 domain-containing protein [Candidatus Xenobia bacterium]
MTFSAGIIGLPESGKTTVFNALTGAHPDLASAGLVPEEVQVGRAAVPDRRLVRVAELFGARRTVPLELEIHDVWGLGHQAFGMGEFTAELRELNVLLAVLRGYDAASDPRGDLERIRRELVEADRTMAEKSIERRERAGGESRHLELLRRVSTALENGDPVRCAGLSREERDQLRSYAFLTLKPMVYVANLGETAVGQPDPEWWEALKARTEQDAAPLLAMSAEVESHLAMLSAHEADMFTAETGIKERTADRVLEALFGALDCITFFTANEKEARAWAVPPGTTAVKAAGEIHTDLEKGFVAVDVLSYHDLMLCGSATAAREQGAIRREGRDYRLQDGDILRVEFSRT